MNRQIFHSTLAVAALTGLSFSAQAHTGVGSLHDFSAGFIHPWSGIDHFLAMFAIGLWAAASGGRAFWLLPVLFLSAMTAGASLGFAGIALDGVENWVAFSVLALGIILSINGRMPTLPAALLTVAFALGHGYVHAAEITEGAGVVNYAAGFLSATAALHAVGIVAGLSGRRALKVLRTLFGMVCTLAGVALLAGV